ncbi:stress-response A/B barrel domain-containing protein UP3-like [Argentina anserina]|uniref:stress-response A/B barrel domain-containing protein UP3-like n=1 Tax=Argentina anserina TaxID=57926 RepID=UPI0021765F7E|nr:stress-response A/B barrel domain-containing protein UP3-like [Potentilla anserina]
MRHRQLGPGWLKDDIGWAHLPELPAIVISKHRSLNLLQPHLISRLPIPTSVPISMSSSPAAQTVIEHIVLFKLKDNADPSKVNAWVDGLNALSSLDLTLHLTAGPLFRIRSSPFAFTHLLHSRYKTKDDLAAYSVHPAHISVVKDLGHPVCDDVMAVDWVADGLTGPVGLSPGSAIRVTVLKLKEELEEAAKGEVLEVIEGVKGKSGEKVQVTVGENFSPGRARGYSIASAVVFKGLKEMEEVDSEEELAKLEKDKVREYLDSMIVVDYVVSPP